jgi:hypothetical protein
MYVGMTLRHYYFMQILGLKRAAISGKNSLQSIKQVHAKSALSFWSYPGK